MSVFILLSFCCIAKFVPALTYEEPVLANVVLRLRQEIYEQKVKTDNQMDALRNEIDVMKKERVKLKEAHAIEIKYLRKEMEEMKTQQVELRTEVEILNAKLNVQNCNEEKSVSDADVLPEQEEITVDGTEENPTKTKIKQLHTNEQRIRRGTVNRVAFFAHTNNPSYHLGKDQNIIFDHAVTNIGNAYSEHRGVFIAPVRGTYVFSCTLLIDGYTSWGHFIVNGQIVAKLRPNDGDPSSQTIVVTLNAGDDVLVQNTWPDRTISGDRYSTFSGFLLYDDDVSGVIVG